jgi:hypothetical protein
MRNKRKACFDPRLTAAARPAARPAPLVLNASTRPSATGLPPSAPITRARIFHFLGQWPPAQREPSQCSPPLFPARARHHLLPSSSALSFQHVCQRWGPGIAVTRTHVRLAVYPVIRWVRSQRGGAGGGWLCAPPPTECGAPACTVHQTTVPHWRHARARLPDHAAPQCQERLTACAA